MNLKVISNNQFQKNQLNSCNLKMTVDFVLKEI